MFKKVRIILMAVLAATVLSSLISCGSVAVTSETVLTSETIAPVSIMDISQIEAVPMDNKVAAGDIEWKILSVDDRGESIISADNYSFNAVTGKFVILEFMLKNNSDDIRILYDLNVIDNKGRVYSLCLPAYAYISTPKAACALVEIVSGVEYTFTAPFDVAPDSEGLLLEVTDLATPPVEKVYIDLGQ